MTVVGEAFIKLSAQDNITPNLKSAAGSVEKELGEAGEKGKGRFSAALKGIGATMATALGPAYAPIAEITEKIEGLGEHLKDFKKNAGASLLGIGGIATTAGVGLITMADKGKIASGQLQTAVTNAGGKWEEYKEETEKVIKAQEHYGNSAVDTQGALQTLVQKTGDVKKSYENMALVTNIAAAKHISLKAAAALVGGVINGNTRVLKQFGITQDQVNAKMETAKSRQKEKALNETLDAIATDKARLATLKDKDATLLQQIADSKSGSAKQKLAKLMQAEELATLKATLAKTKDKKEQEKLKEQIDKITKSKFDDKVATLNEAEATQKIRDIINKDKQERQKLSSSIKDNTAKSKDLKKELKDMQTPAAKGSAAIELLSKRMKGQADVAADTFTGKMKEAKAKLTDFTEELAGKVGPALTKAGPVIMGVGAVLQSGLIGKLKGFGKTAEETTEGIQKISGVTKIWTGIQWLFNAAMSPMFLIPAAIAALVAAFVIAYIKIKPFHDLVNAIGKAIGKAFIAAFNAVKVALSAVVKAFETAWNFIAGIVKKYGIIILALIAPFIGIPLLIATHWKTIINFFQGLFRSVANSVSAFVSGVVGFFSNLWTRASNIVRNIINSIVTFFKNLPAAIVSALATLGGTVAGAIGKAFSGLHNFIVGIFSSAGTWLRNAGINVVQGLINGAKAVWSRISGLFTTVKTNVVNALRNASTWLLSVGTAIVHGLTNGISSVIGGIGNIMGTIKSDVFNGFSNAGQWLWDIGSSIISGLWNGLKSMWNNVTGWFAGIGSWIKAHKGPPSADKVMLTPHGQWIMEGLIKGLENRMPHLRNSLEAVARQITSQSFGSPMGGLGIRTAGAATGFGAVSAGGSRVINLFPDAHIDFGKMDPAAIVQRLANAVTASRL